MRDAVRYKRFCTCQSQQIRNRMLISSRMRLLHSIISEDAIKELRVFLRTTQQSIFSFFASENAPFIDHPQACTLENSQRTFKQLKRKTHRSQKQFSECLPVYNLLLISAKSRSRILSPKSPRLFRVKLGISGHIRRYTRTISPSGHCSIHGLDVGCMLYCCRRPIYDSYGIR